MRFSASGFAGEADLRRMQDLVVETRHLRGLPARHHAGDLAWRHAAAGGAPRIRLWEVEDLVVAWGWLDDDGRLDLHVHPDVRGDVVPEVLAWAEAETEAPALRVEALDGDPATLMALAGAGYAPADAPDLRALQLSLALPPRPPQLPEGYRARALAEGDAERRAAVHSASFPDARVAWERVQATWPYRPELDWAIEGPDGAFVAACTVWPDVANGVALVAQVGVDPAHRRQGFGAAVCLAALREAQAHGLRTAIAAAPDEPAAAALAVALGFDAYGRLIALERQL